MQPLFPVLHQIPLKRKHSGGFTDSVLFLFVVMIFLLPLSGRGMCRNDVNNLPLCHCLGWTRFTKISSATFWERHSLSPPGQLFPYFFASTTQQVRKSGMGITCVTHPSIDISAESMAFWIRPCLRAPTSGKVDFFLRSTEAPRMVS